MVKFDYSKLRGKVAEKLNTNKAFADSIGISYPALSARFKGDTPFSQKEIAKAIDVLDLTPDEAMECFFTPEVQEG